MVGLQVLVLSIGVRIPVPEKIKSAERLVLFFEQGFEGYRKNMNCFIFFLTQAPKEE